METPFNIRNASVADLPVLVALDHATFGDKPYPGFFFRQALELWPDFLLLAESETVELQGYVLAAPATEPDVAWILSLAVDDAARGKGIGKALVQRVVEAMQARQITTVRLTAHPENVAVRLYEKLGFSVVSEDPDYFRDSEPRAVLERFIG